MRRKLVLGTWENAGVGLYVKGGENVVLKKTINDTKFFYNKSNNL